MATASDTFTGSSGSDLMAHVANSGQAWSGTTSQWQLDGSGNVFFLNGTNVTFIPFGVTPASADYDVSFTPSELSSTPGQIGIIGRGVDQLNFYALYINTAKSCRLFKYVAGASTNLGSTFTWASGALTLHMVGSSISVKQGATTVIGPVTDTAFASAGKAGLYGWTSTTSTTGYHAGAFSVTDASGTTLTCPAPVVALNLGTSLTLQAPSVGGTSPITYSWQSSPDNSTWTTIGSSSTTTRFTFTGLPPSTLMYFRYTATTSDGTPQVVTSSALSLTTFPILPAFQATFTNWANGTSLVNSLYQAETGDTFSVLLSGTSGAQGLVTSSGLTGVKTNNQFLGSRTLAMNAPLDAYFTLLAGTTTSAAITIGTRFNPADSSGLLFSLTFSGLTNSAKLGFDGIGGSYTQPTNPSAQAVAPTLSAGNYRIRFHADGLLMKGFLQRLSDSNWWTGTAWQSASTAFVATALPDSTYYRTGSPFFILSAASTNITLTELQSTQTVPIVGIHETDWNFVKLVFRPVQGNAATLTTVLQRSINGGSYSTIKTLASTDYDQPWYDTVGIVPSQSHAYKLVATDSGGIVTTSAIVTTTTPAASTPPTVSAPHTPGTPITACANNTLQNDTQGNSLNLHAAGFLNGNGWDQQTGLYWAVGQNLTSGSTDQVILYSSSDRMNWENRGVVLSAAIGGYSSTLVPRLPRFRRHPTSGYYAIICNLCLPTNTTTLASATLAIFSSTTLQGTYGTTVYNGQPGGIHVLDIGDILDDDGSLKIMTEVAATGATVVTMSSDWITPSIAVILPLFAAAPANRAAFPIWKRGGIYYTVDPPATSGITYAYGAGLCYVSGSMLGPWCPTPGPFVTADGTFTAANSLKSQPNNVMLSRGGDWIYQGDDYNIGTAGGPLSGNVWQPLTYDAGGAPSITYGSTFTPAVSAPSRVTVSGPASISIGTPATFTATLDYPAQTGGVVFTPSISGFAGTLGGSPVTIASGSSSGTFTVTASSAAAGAVGGTSPGLTVISESVTSSTGTATTATITGPSSLVVGVQSTDYTVTLNAPPASTLVYTPSLSGFSGTIAPTTVSINTSSTTATFKVTSSTAASGSVGGSGSGLTTTPKSVVSSLPPTLVAGTASFGTSSATAITGTATEATGGTGTITHQWQRNTDGGSYSNLSGATSLTLNDTTAVSGHTYGYKLVYTDSAGSPQTATSNAFTAAIYSGGALSGGGLNNLVGGGLVQ